MVDNEELKLDNNNNNFSLNSLNISNNSLNISSSNCNNISSSNCNNICNNNSTNDLNNSNINLSGINNYDYDNSENLSNNSTATQQQSNNNIGTPTNMTTTFHNNNNNNNTINKKISKKPTKTTINKRTLKTTTKVTINHTTKGVSLKNTIISSLVLTPAIVCLWWSLWSCIEALPFPGNHFTRAWVIFFGSHVFFIFFFALPQHLWMKLWEKLNEEEEDEEEDDDDDGWKMLTKKKKIKKRKRKKMGMVRLVFSGIASVMMICQWVGCWGLLDWWLGQVTYHDRLLGPEQWQQQQQQQQPQQWLVGAADAHLWLNILISYTLCIFFRFSSNVCCKVSMAERDLPGASFFTSHTRFKCKPSFSLNYLYDSLFSNIFLLSISIHFWRSLWMSYDYYILPQHEVFSSSLGVAVVLAVEFCRFVWISFIGERRRLGAGGCEKEDEREEIEEIEEDGNKQGRNGSSSFKLDMEEAEANGLCSEKLDVDGFVIKEFDFNGLKEEKWDFNGLDLNGLDMGRLNVDGLKVDGFKVDGLKVDGLKVDGLKVDGFKVDGLVTKKQKSHVELTKGMNGVRQVFVEAVLNGTHNNLHNKNYQHNNKQHNNNQHNNNQHNNNRNNNYHYQKNNNNNNQHNNQQSDNHQHNKNSNTRNNNNNDNNIINNNKIISNNNNNNIIINNNNNNNNNNDDDETLLASSFDTTTPSDSASLEGEDGLIRVNQMVMRGNGMVGKEMVEGGGGVVRDCMGNHVIKVGDSLDVGRRFEEEGASFKSWLSSVVCSLITNLATILYWRSLWNLYTLFTKHTLPPHWVVPCQVLLAIFSFGALYSAGFSQFIARNTFSLDGEEENEDNEDTFSSQSAIT